MTSIPEDYRHCSVYRHQWQTSKQFANAAQHLGRSANAAYKSRALSKMRPTERGPSPLRPMGPFRYPYRKRHRVTRELLRNLLEKRLLVYSTGELKCDPLEDGIQRLSCTADASICYQTWPRQAGDWLSLKYGRLYNELNSSKQDLDG